MKKVLFSMLAIALAIGAVATTSAKSKKFVTVYWYYVTNTVNAGNPSATTVDNTQSPLPGYVDENESIAGCNASDDIYCAKGFTAAQVNSTTHKPATADAPGTYFRFKAAE